MYAWGWEPHWLEIVERSLAFPDLPKSLDGARVAHVSDLHAGPRVDDAYLIHSFARLREIVPEIVVYTGDLTDVGTTDVACVREVFSHLPTGSLATFGILGNHDYGPRWSSPELASQVISMAGAAGLRILRNEVAEVDGLQIAGLDDYWARQLNLRQAMSALNPRRASLVLTHNPDTVDMPGWEPVRGWILAGHTHGGQCKPPFLPPPILSVRNRRYTSGEFSLAGDRRLYISRGVGHTLRVRFNARPEIAIFRLQRA
jgi:predicted MPP superfamily phosphohydrolase